MDGRRKSGAGRPRKACGTCKAQKVVTGRRYHPRSRSTANAVQIRCTEERPSCKRCVRLRHVCTYGSDPPPERSNKRAPRETVRGNLSSQHAGNSQRQHTAPAQAARITSRPLPILSQVGENADDKPYLGIPHSLLLELVDRYYENVYNAHLLLHKRLFLESIAEGTACPHVVLSVCAWGAKFYRDAGGDAVLKEQGFMVEWAQRAGKLVFQDAEELAQDNIVTFLNLALFWHSQGSWRIAYLYKGNAFQCQDIRGLGPRSLQTDNTLESEIRRRHFWACYIMHCHTAERGAQFEPKGDILNLPLPWPDEDFEAGVSRRPPANLNSKGSDGEVFSEFIKGTTIWSAVVSLLKSPETNLHVRIPAILALDEQLSEWWRTVPSDLKLTPSNIKDLPRAVYPRVLHTNILYHQSLCALHASLVPLFCCSPGDGWSAARQISAQIAFEHAGEVSALIAAILETTSRTSAVPMFVGYAAYCGCAIQIPFMWCSNPAVRERIHANIRANTKLLQLMTVDWKFASLLGTYVHYLYTLHSKRTIILEDEPKNIAREKLTCFNGNIFNTRASIFEYIAMLRTEGGGYGSPDESSDHEAPGEIPTNVAEPQVATTRIQNDTIPIQDSLHEQDTSALVQGDNQQLDYPTGEIGNVLDLLYPFKAEMFNFALDDDMIDLPSFEMDQFDFSVFDTAP
ncbi:hypothetical protein F5Y19DRAFT_243861 [Xylariaceae sp. FL1651]|nr:hypothetical protein F5Y19DRAFT_243861 [Xylariaceae sp. FL1651]